MNRRAVLPSVLETDPQQGLKRLKILAGFCNAVHLDVCDGRFSTTKTFDLLEINRSILPPQTEFHLMVADPLSWISQLARFQPKRIIFHLESEADPRRVIKKIHALGIQAGIALNPPTALAKLEPFVAGSDLAVIMGVEPGAQARPFQPLVLNKIVALRERYPTLVLEVDGGMHPDTIPLALQAGASIINIGSELWNAPDPKKRFAQLRELVRRFE